MENMFQTTNQMRERDIYIYIYFICVYIVTLTTINHYKKNSKTYVAWTPGIEASELNELNELKRQGQVVFTTWLGMVNDG